MCYKEEKHKKLSLQLEEKFKDVPDFITSFFVRYKSATTKNCNWGYIRDLLQWLINRNYICKNAISDIIPEDLNRITPEHITEYFVCLQAGIIGRKNSLDSINTKKNVFGAFWSYLVKRKYVEDNIIQDDSLKRRFKSEIKQKEVKVPTDEQLEDFICKLNDGNSNEFNIIRNLAIVKLIMGSGIRSEELINLDIKDLYLDEDKPYIMILGKGNIEQYDKVFISQDAKNSLIDYLIQREIYITENNIENLAALFLSNDQKRISKSAMKNFFNRYSNGNIYPHMLRHWVGTKLYEKTKDIVLVQKQLRHASLETAAKYYVRIDENKIADAMVDL